jgi:ABC-type dipeptide/oligopeptide/nickel transport system permease subunit
MRAAVALGASEARIMLQHVLPNVFPTMLVMIALSLGQNILLQSALSFLGLIASQTPDWGSMLNVGARQYMEQQPWLAIAPGAAIALMVLAYNLLGDALRDTLDPRLRGTGSGV